MFVQKIQDVGVKPLNGIQEQYWKKNIIPKFQRYRPGAKFKFIPQEEILKKYKIKAFEYGRWTTQNERLDFLASAVVSFDDLKKVTKLKSIGQTIIGIAYGARGKGGFAAAHFEPHTFMINLTRKKGFGSFAHEYGHALDYFFGGYIDQSKKEFALSGGRVKISIKNENPYPKSTLRHLMFDLLSSIRFKAKGKESDSYQNWKKTADSDYWFRSNEIFARAFEQWIQYKLSKLKISNTFLNDKKYSEKYYLSNSDLLRIAPKMQKLINEMSKLSK